MSASASSTKGHGIEDLWRPSQRVAAIFLELAGSCARMLFRHAVLLVPGLLAASLAAAQDRPKPPPPEMVWAGQPVKETPYTGPNRPIWRLSELLAAHNGRPSWTQTVAL